MMDMRVKTERNNWRKKWDQGGKMLNEEWRETIVETLKERRSARREV